MHTPLVSAIVPTKNSAATLERCLASIRSQSYPQCEIIVVDNYSTDRTLDIARQYANCVLIQGPERSTQRNYGAHHAKGDFVVFIDSDMEASVDVVAECVDRLMRETRLQALAIPVESTGTSLWAKCKKMERDMYAHIPWLRGARFFRKHAFEQLGGFRDDLVAGEDFDLHQRAIHAYGTRALGLIDACVYHDEQYLSFWENCRKKFYYGTTLRPYARDRMDRAYFIKQADPMRRLGIFFSQPGRLIRQPVIGTCMITMKLCEFACGAAGYLFSFFRTPTIT